MGAAGAVVNRIVLHACTRRVQTSTAMIRRRDARNKGLPDTKRQPARWRAFPNDFSASLLNRERGAREYLASYSVGVPVEELISSVQMTTPPWAEREIPVAIERLKCWATRPSRQMSSRPTTCGDMRGESPAKCKNGRERSRNLCMHGSLKS